MRQLKNSDMYKLSLIVDKIGLTVEVKDKSQEQVGADIMMQMVKGLHKAEEEINALISDLTGESNVADMPLGETIKAIKEIMKMDGVADFLSSTGK